jgi:hypothetical protein
MKKLFGVMILAAMPVACGTTNPNAPEAAASPTGGESAFSASALGSRTTPAPAPCSPVTHVTVNVVDRQPGIAYFSVDATSMSGDNTAPPCGRPTWTVTPAGRGVRITGSETRNVAYLEAPRGTYVVSASYPGLPRPVFGSATVSFR